MYEIAMIGLGVLLGVACTWAYIVYAIGKGRPFG